MNANPTTTIRKIGSALDSLAETSMLDAVVPPTRIFAPVLPSIADRSWRMRFTRSAVACWLGPVLGTTWMTATPLVTTAGVAVTTSSILASDPAS